MHKDHRLPFADYDACILAAGRGSRLGLGPKGLLTLGGRPLALWPAEALRPLVRRVIIALPADAVDHPAFRGTKL
jgi:molybdopterin-guanine dinucleotide biosynthesis protein A